MWVKPDILDLTYCTNIHAGESWREVEESLREYAIPLKRRLFPHEAFGLGLRLSAVAAEQLLQGDSLQQFRQFLDKEGFYVALINGFPYGSFHGEVVKTKVFAPDWRDPSRLHYTRNLAKILNELLPESINGGISTIPLSYKPWIPDASSTWPQICENLAHLAAELVHIRERTGRLIHLDIEPEPNGLIETTAEFIAFFEGPLVAYGAPALAKELSLSVPKAEHLLREHIQVCFDVCHIALQFEDPVRSLEELQRKKIGVGRIQVSSALRVIIDKATGADAIRKQLAPFADDVYLHQVVERTYDDTLQRFPDLDDAFASLKEDNAEREWRIHFHLPLFTERFGQLLSTQAEVRRLLAFATEQPITKHLEIETYTWHVLPQELKIDLLSSLERELQWILQQVAAPKLCTKP